MADFDYQWKNVKSPLIEYNDDRVTELLNFTKINQSYFKGKYCLDAGSGVGRYTYALLKLGAKVDSIDVSEEGIKKVKEINKNAWVQDILKFDNIEPKYDFILSWGVIHHTPDPRKAFHNLVGLLKPGGKIHIMLYNKRTQGIYEGDNIWNENGREIWKTLNEEERLTFCQKYVDQYGGNVHGWYDAFNPTYNYRYDFKEVTTWFREEGLINIKQIRTFNKPNNPLRRVWVGFRVLRNYRGPIDINGMKPL